MHNINTLITMNGYFRCITVSWSASTVLCLCLCALGVWYVGRENTQNGVSLC